MQKKNSIFSSAMQLAVITILIKILGLVKKSIIATYCGATAETDAYFIASDIMIALCFVFFSSISISLLSMHTDRLLHDGRSASNNLINAVIRTFVPVSALVALIFVVFSKSIAWLLAPSYEEAALQNLSSYLRMMAVMFVFTCYFLIITVVLETDKIFLPGKVYSFFYSLFVIIAVLIFYPQFGIGSLIWALVLSSFAQCILVTLCAGKRFRFQRKITSEKSSILKLLYLAMPLFIGNAISEINSIIDRRIATDLGQGSVSLLSYGAAINESVTTLMIGSLSTVLFSHYATWVAEGNIKRVKENAEQSLKIILAIVMPVMIMCIVAGDTIVGIMYGRGNFDSSAVAGTTDVLIGYAIGFFSQGARATLVKIYYAFQDTKTPMINGAISVVVNVILSIVLSRFLGTMGIALATSIATLLATILLLSGIRRHIPDFSLKSDLKDYAKIIFSTGIILASANVLRCFLNTNIYLTFLIVGFYIVSVYIVLLTVFKVINVKYIKNKLGIHTN